MSTQWNSCHAAFRGNPFSQIFGFQLQEPVDFCRRHKYKRHTSVAAYLAAQSICTSYELIAACSSVLHLTGLQQYRGVRAVLGVILAGCFWNTIFDVTSVNLGQWWAISKMHVIQIRLFWSSDNFIGAFDQVKQLSGLWIKSNNFQGGVWGVIFWTINPCCVEHRYSRFRVCLGVIWQIWACLFKPNGCWQMCFFFVLVAL